MAKQLQVLVVDNQPRARQSMKALLATSPQVHAVREAINGIEALHRVEECQPDVILMDVRMPGMDGLEATRLIKRKWPLVKVIVLSMYPEYRADALFAGADAFINKGESPERLLGMLSKAAQDAPETRRDCGEA